MVLKLGVLHCGGHPQGATIPLPEVNAALHPVHPVVIRAHHRACRLPCKQFIMFRNGGFPVWKVRFLLVMNGGTLFLAVQNIFRTFGYYPSSVETI